MQSSDLVKYINNPQLLDKQSVAELQKLTADFPYFQPAHLLLSMASRKWDASVYQQSLKKTAIVATNREHLYHLVHAEEKEPVVVADKEEPKAELLKAAAVAEPEVMKTPEAESVEEKTATVKIPTEETKPVEEQVHSMEVKPKATPEETLEKEIEKQVVTSFVEKEILKTPELHRVPAQETPENFGDWLALIKKNNGQPFQKTELPVKPAKEEKPSVDEPAEEQTLKKQKHRALIDKIIENNPGHIRNKEEPKFFTADVKAKESLRDNEHLVTETLAKIYALQGNVNKAVRAYEILSLKFPQKSAYFATLIQKLKNNQ